jgi:hypothetical protein
MKHFVTFIILSLCLIGCTNNTHDAEWNKIDNCIQRSDTTALQLLRKIGNDKDNFSKADRMRYELLLASAHNKFFVSMKSDSTMKDVVDYYSDKGNDNELMEATYLLGCVYRDKGDTPLALKYYEDAIKHADVSDKDCDFYTLSRIYGQMAGIFEEQDSYNIMLSYFKLASKYAFIAKDTLGALSFYREEGLAYYFMSRYDSVFVINKRVRNLYSQYGYKELAVLPSDIEIYIYLLRKDFFKAKHNMDVYDTYLAKTNKQVNGYGVYDYYKGLYYLGVNKIDSARYYFERELYTSRDYNSKQAAAKGLFMIYKKKMDADSIAKYRELWNNAVDSSYAHMATRHLQQMHAIFDYSRSQKLAADKASENSRLWFFVYILLFISTIIAGCIYIYLRNLRLRSRKRLADENERYSDILYRYNQLIDDMHNLKSDSTSYQHNKELEIDQLRQQLSLYQGVQDKSEALNIEQNLLSHQIVRKMHGLARHSIVPSDAEWKALESLVSELLSDFYCHINAPEYKLSAAELKTCILIRLSFIPSEISVLLDITKQRMTNIRASINKKLFQLDGTKQVDIRIREL